MLAHDSFPRAPDGSPFHARAAFVIRRAMTNRIALGLALFLAVLLALNFALGLDWHIFWGRKFLELVRLLAFWR